MNKLSKLLPITIIFRICIGSYLLCFLCHIIYKTCLEIKIFKRNDIRKNKCCLQIWTIRVVINLFVLVVISFDSFLFFLLLSISPFLASLILLYTLSFISFNNIFFISKSLSSLLSQVYLLNYIFISNHLSLIIFL